MVLINFHRITDTLDVFTSMFQEKLDIFWVFVKNDNGIFRPYVTLVVFIILSQTLVNQVDDSELKL
jgi:hypothetical protein